MHHSHCAFVNFQTRAGAEAAAESCQGKAVIAGCPLRIQWGKPRPLGTIDRAHAAAVARNAGRTAVEGMQDNAENEQVDEEEDLEIAKPPGADEAIVYPSQQPL